VAEEAHVAEVPRSVARVKLPKLEHELVVGVEANIGSSRRSNDRMNLRRAPHHGAGATPEAPAHGWKSNRMANSHPPWRRHVLLKQLALALLLLFVAR
jgi:hypothetical protein